MALDLLTGYVVDPDLAIGARNAIQTCLRVRVDERVTIITDRETADITAALVHEVARIGADCVVHMLEDYASRPLVDLPEPILADLVRSQVSLFVAQAQDGEVTARMAMTDIVTKYRIRHGHMININRRIMRESMRADYYQVDRLGTWLLNKAAVARKIHVSAPGGTDIMVRLAPHLKWLKTSGLIQPEKWGNLPGGEVFTAPDSVDGRYVVDGVVGDFLCARYGDLAATPLSIDLRGGYIVDVACENEALLKDFWNYIEADENSNRVGEFAIGINLAARGICGAILQDEKVPGVHMAFGNPYPHHTGQTWTSSTHLDCVVRDATIVVDGETVMRGGAFLWQDDQA